MNAGALLLIIILIFAGIIVFWALYYAWVIYNFISSFARDIIRKLR